MARRTSISSPSLATHAYVAIRDRILRGEISLGQAISRRQMAVALGMSFIPVSEAMRRLESEGILESLPRVGTRVRIPTAQDVRDCYIIREALEVQAARLFCERSTLSEKEELTATARKLDLAANSVVNEDDRFAFQSLHLQFHLRIAECTGCKPLCELLERNQVLIFNWLFDVAADANMPSAWHETLIKELTGNDPDAAALAMGRHIRSGMGEIQSAIAERYGSKLSWMRKRPGNKITTA